VPETVIAPGLIAQAAGLIVLALGMHLASLALFLIGGAIAVLDRAGRRVYARSDGSVLAPQSSTTTRSPGAGR